MNRSVAAALKPGGRLAIIDFVPTAGSERPVGLPAIREGHGIRPETLIDEVASAGLSHVRTIPNWPDGKQHSIFLVLFRKPAAVGRDH